MDDADIKESDALDFQKLRIQYLKFNGQYIFQSAQIFSKRYWKQVKNTIEVMKKAFINVYIFSVIILKENTVLQQQQQH